MAPSQPKPIARKRNRKRKRRAVSSSSSSSDSGSSSSESDEVNLKRSVEPIKTPTQDSSSESDSSSTSESVSDSGPVAAALPDKAAKPQSLRKQSLSPSPPPAEIPPFTPPKSSEHASQTEQMLKEKFRKFWMASVADGFKDDLEEIRKEPNLGTSRLALLIDSLASGAEVFSSSSADSGINEMEVVLES